MSQHKIQIAIPIRKDSSRLPNKFMQLIGDKPLIQHVYDRAIQTGFPVTVVVDDPEFAKLLPNCVVNVFNDNVANGTDRVAGWALKEFKGDDDDIIVNCQGDLPFVEPQQIIAAALATQFGDVGTLVSELDPYKLSDPNTVKAVGSNLDWYGTTMRMHWFLRAPLAYGYHHIGVYAFKRKTLVKYRDLKVDKHETIERLEQLRWLTNGFTIAAVKTNQIPVEVNTPEDLDAAREYYNAKN